LVKIENVKQGLLLIIHTVTRKFKK